MQGLKHMIKLEVEKNVFSLMGQEPELKEINDKIKEEMAKMA